MLNYQNCGSLDKNWIIVETVTFDDDVEILICSCKKSLAEREKLLSIRKISDPDFVKQQKSVYCLHQKAADLLQYDEFLAERSDHTLRFLSESNVDILSMLPFAAAVNIPGRQGYGIVYNSRGRYKCQTCLTGKCPHAESFVQWNSLNEVHDTTSNDSTPLDFKCMSSKPIVWPFSNDMKKKFRQLKKNFPTNLYPQKNRDICEHGQILKEHIVCENATIHRECIAEDGYIVYQYETADQCCKIAYDGQDHLLLNLDNQNFIEYEWLIGILKRSQQTSYPLQAALRAAHAVRDEVCEDSLPTTYYRLYKAYNCFTR